MAAMGRWCATAMLALGWLLPCLPALALPIPQIAPDRGLKLTGLSADEAFFVVAAGIGDYNGDGFDDLAVGLPYVDRPGAADVGRVDVYFGAANGVPDLAPAALASATRGFRLTASTLPANSRVGVRLAAAGDVNCDGLADFMVGFNSARVTVVYGRSGTPGDLDFGSFGPTRGFSLIGNAQDNSFAARIAGGGDLNGDGCDEIAAGSVLAGKDRGRVYVMYGKPGVFQSFTNAEGLADPFGFIVEGSLAARLGASLALGPDVTGDGRDDLLLGADQANIGNNGFAGAAYLVGGRADNFSSFFTTDPRSPEVLARFTGNFASDRFGASLALVGDFDGDGRGDLVISSAGKQFGPTSPFAAYVYRGRPDFPADQSITAIDGVWASAFVGPDADSGLGSVNSLAVLPDRNGDGRVELLLGAQNSDVGALVNAGRVYVLDGRPLSAPSVPVLGIENGTLSGEFFTGATSNYFGGRVTAVGRFAATGQPAFAILRDGSLGPVGGELHLVFRREPPLFGNGFESLKSATALKERP